MNKIIFLFIFSLLMATYSQAEEKETVRFCFASLSDDSGTWQASLKNGATLTTLGDEPILALGTSNGYLDFGTDFGQFVASLIEDYSYTMNIYVPKTASLSKNGNFALCLANSSSTGYVFFGCNQSRHAISLTDWSGEQNVNPNIVFTQGQWVNVTYVQKGTTGTIYLNGAMAAYSDNISLHPSDLGKTSKNWLGRSCYSSDIYLYDARYHDVRISNYAYSESEIEQLSNTVNILNKLERENAPLMITVSDSTEDKMSYYLFVYFEDTGDSMKREALRFGISRDAKNWYALNENEPVIGSDSITLTKGLRDPHILRGEDGMFYLVATDMSAIRNGWTTNPGMILMRSSDLVHWTHSIVNLPEAFPESFGDARYVWAPQTIYDERVGKYMIYFTIYRTGGGDGVFYRAYANSDFTSLEGEPEFMFAPTGGGLDSDIVYLDGTYHFFYKGANGSRNGIMQATSSSLDGPWSENRVIIDAYANSSTSVEGSCVFPLIDSDQWILMFDLFGRNRYEYQTSTDLYNFSSTTQSFTKDFYPRHGTVMQITAGEAARIATAFPSSTVGVKNIQQRMVNPKGPTMGWSSWNTYGVNINEDLIKRQADAMVYTGLNDAGYDHINIDDGFFGGRNTDTGELFIHSTRFPNGLKSVADYIHNKGLKAGIYSDAGANTCGNYYNGDTQSVNVGLYNYDQHDADFYFKDCGFDFIKVDFCGGDAPQNSQHLALDPEERYTAISNAIKATGRDDVRLNVCRWNYPGTWVHDVAFSWRTTGDISNNWKSVRSILNENLYLSAYCSDGHYNDMDMLEVGRSLTTEEDKTHFGMWCIMASPLLIGCDLTTIKDETLALITNPELIALNQDTLCLQAYVADCSNGCYILVKDVEEKYGDKRAFAIFNPNDDVRSVTVNLNNLELGGNVSLRDVFERTDIGTFTDSYEVSVPAHGTRIYVAETDNRLERTRYEAETGFISDYQELLNNQSAKTGIYSYDTNCSSGIKAGWLGCSKQNDLLWNNIYSKEGGDYQLTIAYLSGESRNITVEVNGKKIKTVSANSGSWSTVATKTMEIQLQKGDNTVRLYNTSNWMPDIDYIDLKFINTVDMISHPSSKAGRKTLYNLRGIALEETQDNASPGIYIANGQKILKRK